MYAYVHMWYAIIEMRITICLSNRAQLSAATTSCVRLTYVAMYLHGNSGIKHILRLFI